MEILKQIEVEEDLFEVKTEKCDNKEVNDEEYVLKMLQYEKEGFLDMLQLRSLTSIFPDPEKNHDYITTKINIVHPDSKKKFVSVKTCYDIPREKKIRYLVNPTTKKQIRLKRGETKDLLIELCKLKLVFEYYISTSPFLR